MLALMFYACVLFGYRRILYFDYQNTVNSDTQTCTFSLNLGKKHYEWPNVDYVKHAN